MRLRISQEPLTGGDVGEFDLRGFVFGLSLRIFLKIAAAFG